MKWLKWLLQRFQAERCRHGLLVQKRGQIRADVILLAIPLVSACDGRWPEAGEYLTSCAQDERPASESSPPRSAFRWFGPCAHHLSSSAGSVKAIQTCARRPSLKTYWTICVRHAVAPFWCVEILGTAVQRRRCSAATSRSRYPCKRSRAFASAQTIQRCHPPLSLRARTKPCSIQ
jgi:hypothetical protein